MENSVENHRYRHLKKSRVIYTILLLFISFLILLMLIVKIDIYANSPGVMRVDTQSNLIVECFVSPVDVGFLKLNDLVNFQIDAFDHNKWETVNGKILQIKNDVSMVEDKLKYRVICSLNETSSLLSKNTAVHLKIGMALTAKFKIAKRTVFQLLFDKIDDWHDPI